MGATLAVYLAFTEIASDEQNNAFETTLNWLALKSGVSVSTIKRILPDLEEVKAVVIQRKSKGLKGPSFYHLTAIAHPEPTIAHPEPTIAHPEPTIAQSENTPKRATLEQSNEQSENKREEGKPLPDKREPWQIRKDIKADLDAIEAQIKRINADAGNWEYGLAQDVADTIKYLQVNHPEGWQEQIKAREANRKNHVRKHLKAKASQELVTLQARRAMLKGKLNSTIG